MHVRVCVMVTPMKRAKTIIINMCLRCLTMRACVHVYGRMCESVFWYN